MGVPLLWKSPNVFFYHQRFRFIFMFDPLFIPNCRNVGINNGSLYMYVFKNLCFKMPVKWTPNSLSLDWWFIFLKHIQINSQFWKLLTLNFSEGKRNHSFGMKILQILRVTQFFFSIINVSCSSYIHTAIPSSQLFIKVWTLSVSRKFMSWVMTKGEFGFWIWFKTKFIQDLIVCTTGQVIIFATKKSASLTCKPYNAIFLSLWVIKGGFLF